MKICIKKCKNKFWGDVLNAWYKVQLRYNNSIFQNNIAQVPIWYSSNIVVGGKTPFYKKWYNSNIIIINDLLKDSDPSTFYSSDEFNQRYRVNTNFLQYHGLVSAVKKKSLCIIHPE